MLDENNKQPDKEISKKDMLQLHWQNYQMRQSHVWKSLERLILAVVTLWAIPFIKPVLFENSYIILFLPVVALSLSVVGRRLLKAEYNRLIIVIEKFNEFTPDILRPDFEKGIKSENVNIKIKRGQIGNIILKEICVGLITLSSINLLLIVGIAFKILPHP